VAWLEPQLAASAAPGGNSSSSSKTTHDNLDALLSFLKPPGPVLRWLPLKSISLKHMFSGGLELLTFYYKAAAINAVDAMLSYNPILTDDSSSLQRLVAFLITTTGDRRASLLVRAVRANVATNSRAPVPGGGSQEKQICRLNNNATIHAATTAAVATPLSSMMDAPTGSSMLGETPQELAAAAVGMSHPVFGEHLKEAALAVANSSTARISWDTCTANIITLPQHPGAAATADLWVVSW
jgi:hypothetical protein